MASRGRGMGFGEMPTTAEMQRIIESLWVGDDTDPNPPNSGSDSNLLDPQSNNGRQMFPWARAKDAANLYEHGTFWGNDPHPRQAACIERPSADEVRVRAAPLVKRIWENHTLLSTIISRHEMTTQRRWEKKSKVKRREALLQARPSMPKHHRLDQKLLRIDELDVGATRGFPNKDLFLWPTLTQEDLCKTEPLLLLLNARARNPPSLFAHSDLEPSLPGVKIGELPYPPVLKSWNMRLLGQDSPETFGRLVSWDEDPKAKSRLYRGMDVSPGEGLMILEIQDGLYQFLVDVCRAILHDLDLSPAALSALPEEPEPALPTANKDAPQADGQGYAMAQSLATLRYEATYHVPSKLDLDRLRDLLTQKLSESEDAIWSLREDPAFFVYQLHEWYDHRSELMLNQHGENHPILSPLYHDKFIGRVVGAMLSYYLPNLKVWAALIKRVERLSQIKERLFDTADPPIRFDDDLPDELELAFCCLLNCLDKKVEDDLGMILNRMRWSPPMRHLFVRVDDGVSRTAMVRDTLDGTASVTIEGHPKYNPDTDNRVKRSIDTIQGEYLDAVQCLHFGELRSTLGLGACIARLDTVASSREGRAVVTPYMQEQISDIVIVAECIREIEAFRPWADSFHSNQRKKPELWKKIEKDFDDYAADAGPLALYFPEQATCAKGAELFRMKYPTDKPRTKANVAALQAAEAKLDEFWKLVIGELRKQKLMNGRLASVLNQADPERTPDWVEPVKVKKQQQQQPQANATQVSLPSILQPPSTTPKPHQPAKTKTKTKTKTRGLARPSEDLEQEQEQQQQPERRKPAFDVDKRALKVFKMLFFDATDAQQGGQPGEVSWLDFLHAMYQVGFSMTKLGGSMWQFAPGPRLTGGDDAATYARGIQFHEPHPGTKIPFYRARNFGRRLARAFGWDVTLFRVKE